MHPDVLTVFGARRSRRFNVAMQNELENREPFEQGWGSGVNAALVRL